MIILQILLLFQSVPEKNTARKAESQLSIESKSHGLHESISDYLDEKSELVLLMNDHMFAKKGKNEILTFLRRAPHKLYRGKGIPMIEQDCTVITTGPLVWIVQSNIPVVHGTGTFVCIWVKSNMKWVIRKQVFNISRQKTNTP